MNPFAFCEYHIDLDPLELGKFHVVSEHHLPDEIIEQLQDAVKRLSFQYGYPVLKCVEYIDSVDSLIAEDVSFAPTDGDIHLLSISDYIKYCERHPVDSPQIYIMSHDLYLTFRERAASKKRGQLFERLIQEVYERNGLLYAVLVAGESEEEACSSSEGKSD